MRLAIVRNLKLLAMKSLYAKYATFVILWMSYCVLYFTRKPLGIVIFIYYTQIKSFLANKYSYSKLKIGILDSALLLPYSLFQIILGNLGDTKNPTKFLIICMITSGISTILLGPLDKLWFLILSLFFNGTFQAFCWPLMIKIVSIIFTKSKHHNLILGIFGTSAFAGGTLGTLLSVFIKDRLTWKWVYPIPSALIIAMGITLFVFYELWLKRLLRAQDKIRNVPVTKTVHNLTSQYDRSFDEDTNPGSRGLRGVDSFAGNHLIESCANKSRNNDVPSMKLKIGEFQITVTSKDIDLGSVFEDPQALISETETDIKNDFPGPTKLETDHMTTSIDKNNKKRGFRNKNSLRKVSGSFWQRLKYSFVLMWDIPIVGFSALAMFSLKMIRYTFYMWLPFIMEYTNEFSSTKAGNVSAIFEIGGVIGSVLLGFLLDRFFVKNQFIGVITFMILQIGATIAFLLTANPTVNWILNASILLIVGLFIGGLDNIMSSSIPIMLSKTYKPDSASSFIGIINGFGSLGTFLEGPIVGYILDRSSSSKISTNTSKFNIIPVETSGKMETIDFRILFLIIGCLSISSVIFMTIGYLLYLKNYGNIKKITILTDQHGGTEENIMGEIHRNSKNQNGQVSISQTEHTLA